MSVANRMVKELLRLGAYLQREGARMSREYGLSQQQFVVLVVIAEQGPISQKAVLSDLLYEKSNVSKSITRLSTLGLITTAKDARDARVVLCEATGKGREVVASCMKTMKAGNEKWLRSIPDEELERAVETLAKMTPME